MTSAAMTRVGWRGPPKKTRQGRRKNFHAMSCHVTSGQVSLYKTSLYLICISTAPSAGDESQLMMNPTRLTYGGFFPISFLGNAPQVTQPQVSNLVHLPGDAAIFKIPWVCLCTKRELAW
jgi:hypothetical protein